MAELHELIDGFEKCIEAHDPKGLASLIDDLIHLLPNQAGTISNTLAREALFTLRNHRQFGHIRRLAQAFIDDGLEDPQVNRQLAQSMIEHGETAAAISLLEKEVGIDDKLDEKEWTEEEKVEWTEAKSAMGRAWKDQAIRTHGARPEVSALATQNAFKNYREAFKDKVEDYYPGINMVAIAGWDKGASLSAEEMDAADNTRDKIYDYLNSIPKKKLDAWQKATIGETLVSKGLLEQAGEWFGEYANDKQIDAFKLNGTVRQLEELWNISQQEGGIELITPLRAKLGETLGGHFSVSGSELMSMANVTQDHYQRILGNTGSVTYDWMQSAFKTAKSVVLIKKNGHAHGTGYVVKGSDLDPRLGDESYILTNSHVVSDNEKLHHDAASIDEATVIFEVLKEEGHSEVHSVEKILWQSKPERHDASILKLDPEIPSTAAPIKFSKALPALPGEHRLFIIGHPGGREISFSLQDNLLLDYEVKLTKAVDDPSPCRIHYRTPTEYGSSGSPVFNGNWRNVGIHHAGKDDMPKLNDKEGVYEANEGIWIQSIKRALAKEEELGDGV